MFSVISSQIRYISIIFLLIGIGLLAFIIPEKRHFLPIRNFLFIIISIPINIIELVGLVLPLTEVFFICYLTIAIVLTFTHFIILFFLEFILNTTLSEPTLLYITITVGIIILYSFGESLLKVIWRFLHWHKLSKKEFKGQLAKKKLFLRNIVNLKRMKFLIYLLFFFFLIVSSILNLNDQIWLVPKNILQSISYAFVTFIAFDRIIGNLNLMQIDVKQLIYTLSKFNRRGIKEEESFYRMKRSEQNKEKKNI